MKHKTCIFIYTFKQNKMEYCRFRNPMCNEKNNTTSLQKIQEKGMVIKSITCFRFLTECYIKILKQIFLKELIKFKEG